MMKLLYINTLVCMAGAYACRGQSRIKKEGKKEQVCFVGYGSFFIYLSAIWVVFIFVHLTQLSNHSLSRDKLFCFSKNYFF